VSKIPHTGRASKQYPAAMEHISKIRTMSSPSGVACRNKIWINAKPRTNKDAIQRLDITALGADKSAPVSETTVVIEGV
jgi:hypothetical protein